MAMRMLCFCSSSRSARSSMAPVWRWKSSWSVRLLAMMRSSGASAAVSSAGGAAGFRGGLAFFVCSGHFKVHQTAVLRPAERPPHPRPETSPTGVRGHDRHINIAWNCLQRGLMPWQEVSIVDQRCEFVQLAMQEGVNRRELCRRFGNRSRYWVQMACPMGRQGKPSGSFAAPALEPGTNRSDDRGAHSGVTRRSSCLGRAQDHAFALKREGAACPAHSTVHEILRRHGRIVAAAGRRCGPSSL